MTARKGRRHGAAMMVWIFFANLFDPRKAAAVEHVQQQRRLGIEAGRTDRVGAAAPGGGNDRD